MTIGIYLIRLIVSFFFGASLLCLILERYFTSLDGWFVENDPCKNNNALIVTLMIFIISSICLWVIK